MLINKFRAMLTVVVVLIIALWALMIAGQFQTRDRSLAQALARVERNGIYDAERINNWVENTTSFINTFAGGIANLGEDFSREKLYGALLIHAKNHPELFRIYMGYPDGKLLASDGLDPDYAIYDCTQRPWYVEALKHPDRAIISEIYHDYADGERCISFARAVKWRDKVFGVISADIAVSGLEEMLNQVEVEADDAYAILTDMNAYVLLRQTNNPYLDRFNFNDETRSIANYSQKMADTLISLPDGKSALLQLPNGEYRYYSAHTVKGAGWRLYIATAAEELTAPIERLFAIRVVLLTALLLLIVLLVAVTHLILRRAARHAAEESQLKSIFLANMSHEIRTPLNAIIGLSELALSSGALPPAETEDLNKIYASGVTLLGIVNNILDLSKVESGKMELAPVEYSVPSLINDTLTLISAYTGSKEVEFRLHIDEHLPSALFGDDLRIKQIFNNLLSNAFKYTHKGSVDWSVRSEREGDKVWLISTVRDTGIGIRPENLQKIFSNYSQVDTKNNRAIQGTGLGLAIAKKMTEMMDGALTVESEYGFGSVFTVRLRQDLVNNQIVGVDTAKKLSCFEYLLHKRDRNQNLARADLSYARALVVDDVTTNLVVTQGLLKRYKIPVDCVNSGQKAVDAVRAATARYDVIFMDHMMPGMDGVEATRLIRALGTAYAQKVPIIALTANAVAGMAKMFLANGFNDFISKPIDITLLDVALNRWVRDKQKETGAVAPAAEVKPEEVATTVAATTVAATTVATTVVPKNGGDWQAAVREIDGLDVAAGLANGGGTWEVYRHILQAFLTDTTRMLQEIRDPNERAGDYATYAHGLKSGCANAGLTALGEQAKQLELAAKANNWDFVVQNNAAFIAAIEKAVAGIRGAMGIKN